MKTFLVGIFLLGLVGCVPIRQTIYSDRHSSDDSSNRGNNSDSDVSDSNISSGSNKHFPYPDMKGNADYEDPNDYKNLAPDAWKSEMEGMASWYGWDFAGKLTSNGEVYDMNAMTAAHKTLPLGTVVRVKDLDSGKSVEVRINDRGPYVKGRIIDLSRAAAEALGVNVKGTAHVKLDIVKWPDDLSN
jgi:rare lipoprotein A